MSAEYTLGERQLAINSAGNVAGWRNPDGTLSLIPSLASNIDLTVISDTPKWYKVGAAVSYTTFQTAATGKNNTLFSLPAGSIIHAVKLKHSTAFAGALISAMTLSVGISGTVDKYASAFDVLQAVSGTAFELSQSMGTESHTADTDITITAASTGANLSALSAGAVDVWAFISKPT